MLRSLLDWPRRLAGFSSPAVAPTVISTFQERFKAVKPHKNLEEDYDCVPSLFVDSIIEFAVMENPIVFNHHATAIDIESCHRHKFKNPHVPTETFKLIPDNLDEHFSDKEVEALLWAFTMVEPSGLRNSLQKKFESGLTHRHAFTHAELTFLYQLVKPKNPMVLANDDANFIDKLDFYIRKPLQEKMLADREHYIQSLENIDRLKKLILLFEKPIHLRELEESEFLSLHTWTCEQQRQQIILTKMTLIKALHQFIDDTKKIIIHYNHDAHSQCDEFDNVLADERELLQKLIKEIKNTLTPLERAELNAEHELFDHEKGVRLSLSEPTLPKKISAYSCILFSNRLPSMVAPKVFTHNLQAKKF